jgi:hypothetical protein
MGSEVISMDGLDTQPCKASWCFLAVRLVDWLASVNQFFDESYKSVKRNGLRITSQIGEFKGYLTNGREVHKTSSVALCALSGVLSAD